MGTAGQLLARAVEGSGADDFGLRAGAVTRLEDVPLPGEVSAALTVGAALGAAARGSARYIADQSLWVTRRPGEVLVRRRFHDALRAGRRQANDFALQMLIGLLRRAAGPEWRPAEIHFEGPAPAHAEQLAALATRSVRFGAEADCLVFPARLLALPLQRAPRPVRAATAPLDGVDFVESVRATIRWLLELGELNLPNAADAAGTSPRTLQRMLSDAGQDFRRLSEAARFEVALRLLQDPRVRIIDVSTELGYADAANFTRAFRRWSGVPPLEFRRLQLAAGS